MVKSENNLPEQDENRLESIDASLKEILKWTRFANISRLKEMLEAELDSDEKKIAYESSDGQNGLKEVAMVSGAPLPTVATWWQKWFRLGFVSEVESRKGRMQRIASLDDVGIRFPKATRTVSATSQSSGDVQTQSQPDNSHSEQEKTA
ncbi:MAG: hypothetical protein M1587_08940 [Thaumarchaeota archaeon]|nr:hypothetical protein [Nitrososphaerota archaeon]